MHDNTCRVLATVLLLLTCRPCVSAAEPAGNELLDGLSPLLIFPKHGNHFFRIPGIAVTNQGTLLAFAGERKGAIGDFGHDTDVVLRRSMDGGVTWTERETILAEEGIDFHSGPVVVERETGTIFKFARSHGAETKPGSDWRENYVLRNDDDGRTWSTTVLPLENPRASFRFGPGNGGHGIQLANGTLAVQGGYMRRAGGNTTMSLCLIESRDQGRTWQLTKGSDLDDAHVEFCIAETAPGRIYLNVREIKGEQRRRGIFDLVAPSSLTLTRTTGLPGTRCRAGLVSVRHKGSVQLYCSGPTGPAKQDRYDAAARVNLTLFRSDDGGGHWERVGLVHRGKAAYSDLAVLPDGDLACAYESGDSRPNEEVFFVRIPRESVAANRAR